MRRMLADQIRAIRLIRAIRGSIPQGYGRRSP
jgi:hypothetical protein